MLIQQSVGRLLDRRQRIRIHAPRRCDMLEPVTQCDLIRFCGVELVGIDLDTVDAIRNTDRCRRECAQAARLAQIADCRFENLGVAACCSIHRIVDDGVGHADHAGRGRLDADRRRR